MITRDRERLRQFRGFGNAATIDAPERASTQQTSQEQWVVKVFNNETNTYEEVMTILMIATGCTPDEAFIETWEIDNFGVCGVHRASRDTCEGVAKIIATIGIRTEVEQDALASSDAV